MKRAKDKSDYQKTSFEWRRWLMLLVVSLHNFVQFSNMFAFVTVEQEVAAEYEIQPNSVNWLANIFSASYIPSTFLATFLFQLKGVRYGLLFSAVLMSLGCWVRVFSCWLNYNFSILLLGQLTISFSQALCLLSPVRVATDWFRVDEHSLANNIGVYAGSLGSSAGLLLPGLFMSDTHSFDFQGYILAQAVFSSLILLMTITLYQEKPANFPSALSSRVILSSLPVSSGEQSTASDSCPQQISTFMLFITSTYDLLENWIDLLVQHSHFRHLCLANMMLTGILLSFLTVIAQYLSFFNYSQPVAGAAGMSVIFTGLCFAFFTSCITDRWHNYNSFIKVMSGLMFLSTILLVVFLIPKNELKMLILISIPFGLNSAFGPHAIELAVEYTFPLSEDVASGLISIFGSLGGLGFTLILGTLLQKDRSTANKQLQPESMFLIITTGIGFIFTLLCNGQYQRYKKIMNKPQISQNQSFDNANNIIGEEGEISLARDIPSEKEPLL